MKAAIIAIGSEMLGPVRVDTNSLKITAALERAGVGLIRKSIVGDTRDDLVLEMKFALEQADVLVVTGGLGPTEDDLTREALAAAFDLEMEVDLSIIEKIQSRFRIRGTAMPEVNKRQANVFRGQTTLYNERGTAPGFHLQLHGKHIWVFPGVPHELEWMIATYLTPWLDSVGGARGRHRRILKITGLPESAVEEKLKPYYDAHPGEPVTILASPSAIEVHVIAEGSEEEAKKHIAGRERELLDIFGDRVFGYDQDTLEAVAGRLLAGRKETVSVAESCTGGLLSSRFTDVPGSSAYFIAGAVCYDARAKSAFANVDPALIREHGEVSEEVAIALAQGIRARFDTTYGIGVTGIAGPGGGSELKPVGTVHIAVATRERCEHRKIFWPVTRPLIRWFSSQTALDLMRKMIMTS
jgi:nicotinamide-nucleotide amidase